MKKSYIKSLGLLFLLLMPAVGQMNANPAVEVVKGSKVNVPVRLSLIGVGFSAIGYGLRHSASNVQYPIAAEMVTDIGKGIGLMGIGAVSAGTMAALYNCIYGISSTSKDQIKQFLAEYNDKVLGQRCLAGLRAIFTIAGYNVFAKIVDRDGEGNHSLAIKALGIGSYCAFDIYKNLEYVKTIFEEIVDSQNEEIAESQKSA